MKTTTPSRAAPLATCALLVAAAGCSTPATPHDGGPDARDAVATDVSSMDAAVDAPTDASLDAPADTSLDAPADASPPVDVPLDSPLDSQPDVAPDVAPADAPADAPRDARADAAADAGPFVPAAILMAGCPATSSNAYGAAYQGGSWSALASLGATSSCFASGGGVAMAHDGRGIAGFALGSGYTAAIWRGAWGTLTPLPGSTGAGLVGLPVATAGGVIVALQTGGSGLVPSEVDEFDDATSAWTVTTPIPEPMAVVAPPVVAVTHGGAVMVLSSAQGRYTWTLRSGGAWSPMTDVPGITAPGASGEGGLPFAAAVARVGSEQIVAVFADRVSSGIVLASATFASGAWSAPTIVATDPLLLHPAPHTSLAALPDGRVAMAYATSADAIKVGFLAGGAWGTFNAVPGAAPAENTETPVMVAPGAPGAVLELGFISGAFHPAHTRLTNDAMWTWTTPVMLDASSMLFSRISIATAPPP